MIMNTNEFDGMYERYIDKQISEYYREPDVIEKCEKCKCNLYVGDECYYIDNEYYCEDCIEDKFKVVLEKPENDMKGISVFSY